MPQHSPLKDQCPNTAGLPSHPKGNCPEKGKPFQENHIKKDINQGQWTAVTLLENRSRLTPITGTKVAILQFETHLSINYLDREKKEDTPFEDY